MRRIIPNAIFIAILLQILPTIAQVRVGVTGGLNLAKLNFNGFTDSFTHEYRKRFGIGGVLDVQLHKYLSLKSEILYIQMGSSFKELNDPDNYRLIKSLSYIEMPILLKVTFGDRIKPYAVAGPAIGLLLNSEFQITNGSTRYADMKNVTRDFDIGIVFGGGLDIPLGCIQFFLEGRYSFGFYNICQAGDFYLYNEWGIQEGYGNYTETHKIKTRGIQVLMGFTFPL